MIVQNQRNEKILILQNRPLERVLHSISKHPEIVLYPLHQIRPEFHIRIQISWIFDDLHPAQIEQSNILQFQCAL